MVGFWADEDEDKLLGKSRTDQHIELPRQRDRDVSNSKLGHLIKLSTSTTIGTY